MGVISHQFVMSELSVQDVQILDILYCSSVLPRDRLCFLRPLDSQNLPYIGVKAGEASDSNDTLPSDAPSTFSDFSAGKLRRARFLRVFSPYPFCLAEQRRGPTLSIPMYKR